MIIIWMTAILCSASYLAKVVNFETDVGIYYKTKSKRDKNDSPRYIQWLPTGEEGRFHWVFGPILGERKAVFCSFCQVRRNMLRKI